MTDPVPTKNQAQNQVGPWKGVSRAPGSAQVLPQSRAALQLLSGHCCSWGRFVLDTVLWCCALSLSLVLLVLLEGEGGWRCPWWGWHWDTLSAAFPGLHSLLLEVPEAAEVRFWCVAAPPAECSPCRRRGCGAFISQRSCVQARFPWDAWQPSAAPPALAALQPKMKFHFPLSSSRQFWFHCNNGADHVPVPLWDKLAGSASPNLYSPGPKLPSDNRAGMFLLGWQCQGPCPP